MTDLVHFLGIILCIGMLAVLHLGEIDDLRDRLKRIEHLLTADKQPGVTEATHGSSPVTHNPKEDAFYDKIEKKL